MLREIRGEYDGEYLIPDISGEDIIMLYENNSCQMLNLILAGSSGRLWRSVTIDRMDRYCHFYIGTDQFTSPEEFVDQIKDRYPALFEWILFHPEWLRNLER